MIIQRKYVPFAFLYRDDREFRALADRFFSDESIPDADRKSFRGSEWYSTLDGMKRGTALPRNYFFELTDMFVRRDFEKPYDNGMTYEDVDEIKLVKVRRGKVVFALIKKATDKNPDMYVGFVRPSDETATTDVYISEPICD